MENVRFGCLGSSILLQFYSGFAIFTIFGQFQKIIEKLCQKGAKNDPEIDILTLKGCIFEISGGVLRGQILNEFLISKRSAKKR